MTLDEVLKKRRSIRNYQSRQVPTELLLELVKESTQAPSAGNGQPWKFVVVNDPSMLKRMSDESKKNILARVASNPHNYAARYQAMLEQPCYNVYYNAPALVMILGPSECKNRWIDCTLAASYLMLAAVDRGLGTCWVNLGADIQDGALRRELGIREELTIVAPIVVGYPVSIPKAPIREEPAVVAVVGADQPQY